MKKLKGLDGKLDDAWAELVKLKAGHRCEFEGCNRQSYISTKSGKLIGLQSHHFFSRGNRSTRWDINNGFCLCPGHHTLAPNSAHKAPADFVEWSKTYRGDDWYETIRLKANTSSKFLKSDKEEMLLKLQGLIEYYKKQQ